jgi:hypothetical protein
MCKCRQKSSSNKLTNPGFDGDNSGWDLFNSNFRSNTDADNCTGSGSIEARNTGGAFYQCVPTNTSTPTHFYFAYRYKEYNFNDNQPGTGNSYCYLAFIADGGGCDLNNVTDMGPFDSSQSTGGWIKAGTDGMTTAGTTSVMIYCTAVSGTGFYDQIYLGTSAPPASGF